MLSSSSAGRSSMASSASRSSSSSMDRPSLMSRWMRLAKVDGSSSEKPEVSSEVSYRSQMRSLTVLSDWSASDLSRSDLMIGLTGLISIVFLELMYAPVDESRSACAFMMRSMFADQPYSPVTSTHGESAR